MAGSVSESPDRSRSPRGSFASPASSTTLDDQADGISGRMPVCRVCFWIYGKSLSFFLAINPDALVEWALPQGRGRLCRDCGTGIRTVHPHMEHSHLFRLVTYERVKGVVETTSAKFILWGLNFTYISHT